jgi:hypothetical protein
MKHNIQKWKRQPLLVYAFALGLHALTITPVVTGSNAEVICDYTNMQLASEMGSASKH